MAEEDWSRKETGNQLPEVDRAQPQQLQLRRSRLRPGVEDKLVLQLMDSMHNYLSLSDALSSTLRQGWLDLASARHSMGGLRINSSLLDMKLHSAATTVKITQNDDIAVDSIAVQPCFTLRKWVSSEHGDGQLEDNNEQIHESDSILQSSENAEVTVSENLSGPTENDQFCKERSKSLSTFGVLISPKLQASQLSFERALEMLVEIANIRSSVLYSFHQLHQEVEDFRFAQNKYREYHSVGHALFEVELVLVHKIPRHFVDFEMVLRISRWFLQISRYTGLVTWIREKRAEARNA